MKQVVIHTDGSCLGNPGPGGWAAVLCLEGTEHRKELAGGFHLTTNNRMEITGVLEALANLKEPCAVELYTDSQYVRNAVEKGWLKSWQKKNWVKADKKPVKNGFAVDHDLSMAKAAAGTGPSRGAPALAARPCGPR